MLCNFSYHVSVTRLWTDSNSFYIVFRILSVRLSRMIFRVSCIKQWTLLLLLYDCINYPLRNSDDLIIPFCRLSLTKTSYIPSIVRDLKNLKLSTRNAETLRKVKAIINQGGQQINKVPKHYLYGPRKLNIILTQLRCEASFLNSDLHKVNIETSPACSCGVSYKDHKHFFFECTKYTEIRNDLLNSWNWLNKPITLNILTKSDADLNYEENCYILNSVYIYLKRSKRFLYV